MYKEKIIDHTTGEITWRDFTPEEIAKVDEEIEKTRLLNEQLATKEKQRASALAKLAALGLTPEEIAAL